MLRKASDYVLHLEVKLYKQFFQCANKYSLAAVICECAFVNLMSTSDVNLWYET